jgi:glycosyltransferase involved in cell wall biosynthesis
MKEVPKISIIIPIYKVEQYLNKCLETIINQSYKNLEIILVDDGSPDNSGKICDIYASNDSRITVIHKKNGGVSSARNAGLDIAQGTYICFIDADDWIELNALELCLDNILTTGSELCFFNYNEIYVGGKIIYQNPIPGDQDFFQDLDNVETLNKYMNWTASWNFLFKSSLLGKIRFNEEFWIGEDTVFKFQLYKNLSKFSCLRKALYHYRIRSNSCTSIIHPDLPEIIYKRFHIMLEMIHDGGYPNNAELVINTVELIRQLSSVIETAFNGKISFKCNYQMIKKYTDTNEFKEALNNYNKNMVGKFVNCCLRFGIQNRIIVTFFYLLRKIKEHILLKYERLKN